MQTISIIVPIYNAECYLTRCINSILKQTYSVWELLLINDGSTDASAAICDEYAAKDNRIRVFHKENGGVSSARNLGLNNAKGKWITFVDADDYVKSEYLSNLLDHTHIGADLIFSYAEFHYANGEIQKESYPKQIITNENFHLAFTEQELNWHTSPWSKLFKAELCSENRFTEGMPIGEDLVFLYAYMLKCNKIFFSSDTDYCYMVDAQASLTKKTHNVRIEHFVYTQVISALQRLIEEKKITNSLAINKTNWIIASYTRRVLNSFYISDLSKDERLANMATLNIPIYTKHIGKTSLCESIYIRLLELKCYSLYDCLRMFIARFKTISPSNCSRYLILNK